MSETTYESFDVVDEGVGPSEDLYAGAFDTTEGRVFTVTGGDWDQVVAPPEGEQERIVVNMGPQHPSTHGVLRLILELDGETVTDARCSIGYLHTGIEKNLEFRTWTQGVTFVTRMDYVASLANEAPYVAAVEKLLGITDDVPVRANLIRVIALELCRLSSHLVCLGTGGNELGHTTAMTNTFREREMVLDCIEMLSGLRLNNAYLRPAAASPATSPRAACRSCATSWRCCPSGSRESTTSWRTTASSSVAPATSATSTSPAAWRSE